MISAADVEYHHKPGVDHTYAETNWFCFNIPEERILGIIYTVSRKGVPAISCDVAIYGALVENRAESLYFDSQQMLPAPEKLSKYTLPTGLSVEAVNPPRDYRVDYVGYDGCEIRFDFKGLMDPFDIHDPNDSPKAAATTAEQHAGAGMGSGYGGHFDLTGHIAGTLKLRGKEYRLDCVETMDHSWGSRPEIHEPSMGWSHAHWSKDFAIKWINHWDPEKPLDISQTLAHGYVMENGKTYGLVDAKYRTNRIGATILSMEVEVTDKRGKTFRFVGTAQSGGPWICYMSALVGASLMRWQLDDGRVGYGLASEITSMQQLTRKHGRYANQASAHITA